MRKLSLSIAVLVLVAPLGAWASNAIAEQEGIACTACHDKPGSKLLTSEGKYFELMRTLDGYDGVIAEFGSCTSCHVKKPGSKKLTETGKRFEWMMQDMQGLKAWIQEVHPVAPVDLQEDRSAGPGAEGSEPETTRP